MSTASGGRAEPMGVSEVLRVMDVATAIRQDRELVEEQLDLDALKARLRDRMIAAAKVTGEEVTPEEVDAAIAQYYNSLHTFQEPPPGFAVTLAHLWVRRWPLARLGALAVVAAALVWGLFLSPSAPLSPSGRAQRQADALAREVTRRRDAVHALAKDPAAVADADRLAAEADTFRKQADPRKIEPVRGALADLEGRLREEYTVSVADPRGKSGIDRYVPNGGPLSGYYLIVAARRPDGKVIPRRVHDRETNKVVEVTVWAERVPKEVYDRLARDKREDGILDETTFAVKRRGFPSEEVTMPGPDGKPLTRTGQITQW
jgi:hypothetical protein